MAGVKGRSGTNPNSQKNLSPLTEHTTPEQRKEIAAKAGKVSAEKNRQRKEMKEMFEDLMTLPVKNGKVVEEIKSIADAKGSDGKTKNLLVGQVCALAMIKKAMSGDVRAMEFIRDTMGEKPTNKQEIKATLETSPLNSILEQLQGGDEEDGLHI